MLRLNNLSKKIGDNSIVDNVSLDVNPGNIFCLLGANGAGKTSTLNMLLGFYEPSSGNAMLFDNDLFINKQQCRKDIMYIPENVSFYPEFNAIENIEYLSSLTDLKISDEKIIQSLKTAGLFEDSLEKPLRDFSKGMRQKVAIAFAILKDAKLMLMDEPTSGLDPAAIKDFINIVHELKNNNAIILIVTHDLQCAHLLADEIGIMESGKLINSIKNKNISLDEIESIYFKK
jgi:ABC-2 type transport system ATP-binding protein